MRLLRTWGLLIGWWLGSGCELPPDRAVYRVGEVTLLVQDGALSLSDGDRPLWGMAPGRSVQVDDPRERIGGALGLFRFFRDEESPDSFDDPGDVIARDGRVSLTYGMRAGPPGARLEVLVEPGPHPESTRVRFSATGAPAALLRVPTRCDPSGTFHGFGEQYGATDQRGEVFDLFVGEQGIGRDGTNAVVSGDAHTTYFPMPYYLDARGFGVLLQTNHHVRVDLCASDPDVALLEAVDPAGVDLLVLHGPTPTDVVRQLSLVVGRPAPPPDWALGVWISMQGGQDAVAQRVADLGHAGVPATAIWSQDWTGERLNVGGGFGVQYRWRVDPERYPDLGALVRSLHEQDLRFLAYVNPFVAKELPDHYPEMSERGLLIQHPAGGTYDFTAPNGESSHPDLTSSAAVDYVRGSLADIVRRYDVDGWMADFGEWTPVDAELSDGSDPIAFHNRFPIEWHRVNRQAWDEVRPDGDYAVFARSGWTGVQAVSMIHWVGDQEASWSVTDGLPTVVPAMINLGLSGVPVATHDIAGFSGGPSTKELYQRWVELGAFSPVMRTHDGNRRDLNWTWDADAETLAHFRRFARIHQALIPDLGRWRDDAQSTGLPLVRHLLLEFPEDETLRGVSDQYMLGDSLLVAPVVHEGVRSRRVVLPPGVWFDVWTGEELEGGRDIEVDAPIGAPPVFSRGVDRTDLRAISIDR